MENIHLEAGYVCFTGYVLTRPEAELLNRMYQFIALGKINKGD